MQLRNLAVRVYADTPALLEASQAVAADPRLSRCTIEVREGGILQAASELAKMRSPDVLVVGDPADDGISGRLDRLAVSVEPTCKVVVVGRRDSIAMFRQLTTQGIADYLGGNVRASDLFDALSRLFATSSLPKGKVIACLGTSGGAGASLVAATVAADLQQRLGDTILLDLDLAMGTAGLYSGVDIREPLASAFSNPGLDVSLLERIVAQDKGPKVLSTAGALRDGNLLAADGSERVIDVARGMAKALVVDLPRGWNDVHDRTLAAADEIVVVATPDLPALRNARMILDHLIGLRLDGASPKLVMNKVGFARGREYRGDELREALGVKPGAFVPWDPDPLVAAVAAGRPVTSAGGKAMTALRQFAGQVLPGQTRNATISTRSFVPGLKALFVKPA